MESRQTYLIKKRVFKDGKLDGVLVNRDGWIYIEARKLLAMLLEKTPVVCDFPGKDEPVTLTAVHKLTKDGMVFYFRTIGDRTKKNNFNSMPKITFSSLANYTLQSRLKLA